MKIRQNNPEGKNPFLELLGLSEVMERENDETMELFDNMGWTANTLLICEGNYYCANAGDSRWVISRRGRAIELSEDHKPENPTEYKRIIAAGCEIIDGRVDGNLNLSRSLGDLKHKQIKNLPIAEQPITWIPDIKVEPIDDDDDFIVMGWDGIWEVKSSQEVVDFIDDRLSTDVPIQEIAEELLDQICSDDWTKDQSLGWDNMTLLIINLKHQN